MKGCRQDLFLPNITKAARPISGAVGTQEFFEKLAARVPSSEKAPPSECKERRAPSGPSRYRGLEDKGGLGRTHGWAAVSGHC